MGRMMTRQQILSLSIESEKFNEICNNRYSKGTNERKNSPKDKYEKDTPFK